MNTRQIIKRLVQVMRHLLPKVVIAVSFAVLGFLMTLAIPIILVQCSFNALNGEMIPIWVLFLLVGLAIARGLCRYGEHYFGHDVAFKTLADFRILVFQKLRALAPSKLDDKDSGVLLKMIGEDVEALEVFFAHTLPPVSTGIILYIGLMIYFMQQDVWVALIAGGGYLLLMIGVPYIFAKMLEPLLKAQQQTRQHYKRYFLDSLKGMFDLLQYQKIDDSLEKLNQSSQQVNAFDKKVTVANFSQLTSTFLIVGMGIVLIGLRLGMIESMTLSQKITVLVVFSTSPAPFLELSRLPLGFKRAMNAGRHILGLLDEQEMASHGNQLEATVSHIAANQLTFHYPQREQNILEDLSMSFYQRGIVGIVGPSGAGKSTLMKLIMKWYMAQNGTLTINQQDIGTLEARALQKHFAYIPQVPKLFHQTLRENLTLGANITDVDILATLDKCRLTERLSTLEQGLDTIIIPEKQLFSAGELQRLELVRALLKGSDCYIFDEPTSHLDSLNEAILLQVIREHCQGLVYLISHRQSTVSCCDEVYRFENGKLIKI